MNTQFWSRILKGRDTLETEA